MPSFPRQASANLVFAEVELGQMASMDVTVTTSELDTFAALTGDFSPLHMDTGFARARGFPDRVAHGLLIAGYFSRLFGMELPGRNCILHSVNLRWIAPAVVGDVIRLVATIAQLSEASKTLLAEIRVENRDTGAVLARGKVQAGFTQ